MEKKKTNWKKGCLIGCGITFVLLIIAIVVIIFAMGKLIRYSGEKIQTEMEERMPEDYDKQRFRDTFKEGFAAVKDGRIDKNEVQSIGNYAQEILKDGELSTEEMDTFLEMIDTAKVE